MNASNASADLVMIQSGRITALEAEIEGLRSRLADAEMILSDAFLEHDETGVCRPCQAEKDASDFLKASANPVIRAPRDWHNPDDLVTIRELRAEVLTLRERVAFLESPEVCAAAHDDVSECGYCQRDRYYPGYIRYEYLRTLSVRAIAELWASSFMPSGLPLDDMVDRARKAALAARGEG